MDEFIYAGIKISIVHTFLTMLLFVFFLQIACALIGFLGACYTGVLLINLAVALFALDAIENSSHSMGRTYAVLLAFALSLDIFWFILFSSEIW